MLSDNFAQVLVQNTTQMHQAEDCATVAGTGWRKQGLSTSESLLVIMYRSAVQSVKSTCGTWASVTQDRIDGANVTWTGIGSQPVHIIFEVARNWGFRGISTLCCRLSREMSAIWDRILTVLGSFGRFQSLKRGSAGIPSTFRQLCSLVTSEFFEHLFFHWSQINLAIMHRQVHLNSTLFSVNSFRSTESLSKMFTYLRNLKFWISILRWFLAHQINMQVKRHVKMCRFMCRSEPFCVSFETDQFSSLQWIHSLSCCPDSQCQKFPEIEQKQVEKNSWWEIAEKPPNFSLLSKPLNPCGKEITGAGGVQTEMQRRASKLPHFWR